MFWGRLDEGMGSLQRIPVGLVPDAVKKWIQVALDDVCRCVQGGVVLLIFMQIGMYRALSMAHQRWPLNSGFTPENHVLTGLVRDQSAFSGLATWCAPRDFQGNMSDIMSNVVKAYVELPGVTFAKPTSPPSAAEAVMNCINAKGSEDTISWQQYVSGKIGSMKAAGVFSFRHERLNGSIPLTVVTSGSMSRLPQLYAQCLSWPGPLAAVLYQPVFQSPGPLSRENQAVLRLDAHLVAQFVADMFAADACQPEVLLVYEVMEDETSWAVLYPSNMLRSMARLLARTPLITILDVDMLVSRSLFWRFKNATRGQEFVEKVQKGKLLYIMPAFKVRGRLKAAWAEALASGGKAMMLQSYRANVTFQFDVHIWTPGHNLTDYDRWINTTGEYPVKYEFMCEPWVIADRASLPWHDARYRGYGVNKIQMLEHADAQGFTFKVLPDVFIIHRAHKKSASSAAFRNKNKTSAGYQLRQYVQGLMKVQRESRLANNQVSTLLDIGTEHCRSVLPWWQEQTDSRMVGKAAILNVET